jgi:hypothetical protein
VFLKDLAAGRRGETRLLELFRGHGLEAGPNPAKGRADKSRYDVWVELPAGRRTAEVKCDRWEARSGNVALEYHNPRADKPSGIYATAADMWVFILADSSVWGCRAFDLKRHHGRGPGGVGFVRDLPVCGDGNSSSALYERSSLFDHLFFRLDGLPENEFVAVVEILTLREV